MLIHQRKSVADVRNPQCTDTQKEEERWGGRSPFIPQGLPASPPNLCRAPRPGERLLERWMRTGRPTSAVLLPLLTGHWSLPPICICPWTLPAPSSCSPSSSQPSRLLNQSPRRSPKMRRPQPFGELFPRPLCGVPPRVSVHHLPGSPVPEHCWSTQQLG